MSAEPEPEKRSTPWVIRVLRLLISLRVARQLTDDEYMLLTVIAEWQDRRQGNQAVNISRRNLCLRMAISPDSPRRVINAIRSLSDRRLMTVARQDQGAQTAAAYWIDLASLDALAAANQTSDSIIDVDSHTDVAVTPDRLTMCQDNTPGGVTVTPRGVSFQHPGGCHGDTPFTPVFIAPVSLTPESITPPPLPPDGGNESEVPDAFALENKPKRSRRKTFAAPTVDEVHAYCASRKNSIDAEEFIAHYAARGWRSNSGPITDWKSAVITWEKNQPRFARSGGFRKSLAGGPGQTHDPDAATKDKNHGIF